MRTEIVRELTKMDNIELSKTEEAHLDRMTQALEPTTMPERFALWASRVKQEEKKEAKEREGKHGPREISSKDLKDRPQAEREFIEAVAQKDESAKESPSADATKRADAKPKESAQPVAKAGEKSTASESTSHEPLSSADRYWQVRSGQVKVDGADEGVRREADNHWREIDSRMGAVVSFIESHPQRAQIEQGVKEFFAGKPAAWQNAVLPDLFTALAEIPNPGEVFRHIALQPEDRAALRNVKNPGELRAAIKTISKHYPVSASQASPKPRAPKPPSEVGGRGAAGGDGTFDATDWSSFDTKQRQRYAHGR